MVKTLLAIGVRIVRSDRRWSALHHAVAFARKDILRLIFDVVGAAYSQEIVSDEVWFQIQDVRGMFSTMFSGSREHRLSGMHPPYGMLEAAFVEIHADHTLASVVDIILTGATKVFDRKKERNLLLCQTLFTVPDPRRVNGEFGRIALEWALDPPPRRDPGDGPPIETPYFPETAITLVRHGADINTVRCAKYRRMRGEPTTLVDLLLFNPRLGETRPGFEDFVSRLFDAHREFWCGTPFLSEEWDLGPRCYEPYRRCWFGGSEPGSESPYIRKWGNLISRAIEWHLVEIGRKVSYGDRANIEFAVHTIWFVKMAKLFIRKDARLILTRGATRYLEKAGDIHGLGFRFQEYWDTVHLMPALPFYGQEQVSW